MKRVALLPPTPILLLTAAVCAVSLVLLSTAGAAGNEVTLQGEVVDLHCYILHPGESLGEDHAMCAKGCINKGIPAGFLAEDGTLYLLLGPGHDAAKDHVADAAGKQVTLTGTTAEHKGMKAIQVKSVE